MINSDKLDIYANQLLTIGSRDGFSTLGLANMRAKLREVVEEFVTAAEVERALSEPTDNGEYVVEPGVMVVAEGVHSLVKLPKRTKVTKAKPTGNA